MEAELLSVIILQLDFPSLQICSLIINSIKRPPQAPFELVFSNHLNTIHPMHPVRLNTACNQKLS